ncbi:MAG: hypothetical protein AAGA31_19965, partial [Bacteroidota bacterium]
MVTGVLRLSDPAVREGKPRIGCLIGCISAAGPAPEYEPAFLPVPTPETVRSCELTDPIGYRPVDPLLTVDRAVFHGHK